jgi:hypothetical protein
MPGPLMRGRHTLAILQRMGVTETIAETLDDYVAIAARLGRDTAWRAEMKRQISENKHKVYRDSTAIAALEDFLSRVARGAEPVADRQAGESTLLPANSAGPFLAANDSVPNIQSKGAIQ